MNRLNTLSRIMALVCALSFAVPTLPAQESLMNRVKNYFSPVATQKVSDFLHKHRWALAAGAVVFTCSALYAFMKLRAMDSRIPQQPQYRTVSKKVAARIVSLSSQKQTEAEKERDERGAVVTRILEKLKNLHDKESQFVDAVICLRDIAQKVNMQRNDNQHGYDSSISNAELNKALDIANQKVKLWAQGERCATKQDLYKDCSLLDKALVSKNFCAVDYNRLSIQQWEEFLGNVQKNANILITLRDADQEANWS